MNDDLLKQLADSQGRLAAVLERMAEKEGGAHEKAPATTDTSTRLHGLTGIFSGPGLERDVISAHVRPYGISSILPVFPSVSEDPRFPSITGISGPEGAQPDHACAALRNQ